MRWQHLDVGLSVVSLGVALAAIAVSFVAWQRPLPVDPRAIPSFGSGKQPDVIDSGQSGRALFNFLDDHESRLIRIVADVGRVLVVADPENAMVGTQLFVPGPDCPADLPIPSHPADADRGSCNWLMLEFATGADGSRGLYFNSGSWSVKGYFANSGYLDTSANFDLYRVEAVSLVDAVT